MTILEHLSSFTVYYIPDFIVVLFYLKPSLAYIFRFPQYKYIPHNI